MRSDDQFPRIPSLSPPRGVRASAGGFRRVVAVLGEDSLVAHAAAELARVHEARLSVVQTWSPPFASWGFAHPALLPLVLCRECVLSELAAAADARVRAIVRELAYPGPLEFCCRRGRLSTVALSAACSEKYDAVVVRDCWVLRCLWRTGPFRSWLLDAAPPGVSGGSCRVLLVRSEPQRRRL
jgi:hypothetical protein